MKRHLPLERSVATSFSGHETFVFRYAWLKKAADAVLADPAVFARDEGMVRLGVGKNMVRSIRFWALAARVIEEVPRSRGAQVALSALGQRLFGPGGRDPYLEDPNSLWLLHWNLVTNEARSTTWTWVFNLLPANEFTRDALTVFLEIETQRRGVRPPSENSLRRDIDCFVRTYTPARNSKGSVPEDSLDCPLTELGLILDDRASGIYRFKRGSQRSLSDEVFLFCLTEFWDRIAPGRETLAFSEVAYGFGSPGVAFKLDENSLADRLERMESASQGLVSYNESAGLKQLYRRGRVNSLELLDRHYEQSMSAAFSGV
jgi:hypothetical protein